MEIELRFFANFRTAVGQKAVHREFHDDATVGGVLRTMREDHPDLDPFDEDGSFKGFVTVMKNGRNVTYLEDVDTELEDGDTISVFPPVAGG